MTHTKYAPFPQVDINRTWPTKTIGKAPIWCSVDLRDGNQALIEPMGTDRKIRMFNALVQMGYKQIEVGFPSASQTDFDFVRTLIEHNHIPDDVTIQVLVQCRQHLIARTAESLQGAKSAIVHFYNSTSTLQREVVFNKSKDGIKKIAVDGAKLVKTHCQALIDDGCDIHFQYSPESFTQTELPYALEVCEQVMDTLGSTAQNPCIINLPATVEVSTPNIHADQIEWMHQNFSDRRRVILSLHPHNDRGTAVAATELGLMAGADRVEGTLFGNGERTGNVDLVTLGLNLYTQGVDPKIDFSNIDDLVAMVEYCNQLPVHDRHPYAGKLVYTAFSGSHQDAINKGLKTFKNRSNGLWAVPYLPIDPKDVGRSFEAIIRINSQSGKGGVAYVLETDYNIQLPKFMQIPFAKIVQNMSDSSGKEQTSDIIYQAFCDTYLNNTKPFEYITHHAVVHNDNSIDFTVELLENGEKITLHDKGTGPIDSLVKALNKHTANALRVMDYTQHAIGDGNRAMAIAYVHMQDGNADTPIYAVGKHTNITIASLYAIISAFNTKMQATS